MTAVSTTTTPAGAPAAETARNGRRKRASLIVFLAVIVLGAAAGIWYYVSTIGYESTDDAFIAGNVYRIAPQIEGRLARVPVKDNEFIQKDQVIAEIEPADFDARIDAALAALELSKAQARAATVQVGITEASTTAAIDRTKAEVQSAEARLEQERAGLESAKAEASRSASDLDRYSHLSERAVSLQRLDVVRSTAISAEAQVRAAEKRIASAESEITAARSRQAAAEADREQVTAARAEVDRRNAEVKQAEANLHQAQLDRSYCTIKSPSSGFVTNKAALAGDYVKAGQSLLALVPSDVWVVANFKETQLEKMHAGQPVTIRIDAFDADFPGHVDSVQSGSGAQFSLLPPQNATGNYVKVVQRVPVKIVFDQLPDPSRYKLGPGMSVVPTVNVR